LRDQLLEYDLPGIELKHLGDTPTGHPVYVELIDTNYAAGELYLEYRNALLYGQGDDDVSQFLIRARELHDLQTEAEGKA
jgi:hypothetical protein